MRAPVLYAAAAALATLAHAATHIHDFNITWVLADPTGTFPRPVMGINNAWPLPTLNHTLGDRVIINMHNQLGNASTSLHFHGLFQNGTAHMDGVAGVTQCAVAPGDSFTYDFTLAQPGTYWYHAHVRGQYPDGLRGALLIQDPGAPFAGAYAEEKVLALSDWYHAQMPDLIPQFISVANPTGAEPVPDANIMNERTDAVLPVRPATTYLLRIINMGAFATQYFWIEGHSMTVVEIDGVYTDPMPADMLVLTVAQRYAVLVTTKADASANFPIVASFDTDMFDTVPDSLNPNATTHLLYAPSAPLPAPTPIDSFAPLDDITLLPSDRLPLLPPPTQRLTLSFDFATLADGANYAVISSPADPFLDASTYTPPLVPSLYTALTVGDNATNPLIYSTGVNPFVLNHLDVVELVLNNLDGNAHPWHLHGHTFQTVIRADPDAGPFNASAVDPAALPAVPMRRDTLRVNGNSHFVIRFRADNPGVWLFHCHIEWHVDSGLVATIVEAPTHLSLALPPSHRAACATHNTPTTGNAAGRAGLDMAGLPLAPAPLPEGFTPRGIVALTFSIVAALAGCGVIGWYGAVPIAGSG